MNMGFFNKSRKLYKEQSAKKAVFSQSKNKKPGKLKRFTGFCLIQIIFNIFSSERITFIIFYGFNF